MARKPIFLFRGKRGQVIKKLMNSIALIRAMDVTEMARAVQQGRDAVLFSDRSVIERALQSCQDQANTLYSMKG